MKRVVPFIFPLIALLIVLGLLVRWYSLRTASEGQISPEAQNIEVNEVSAENQARLARPAQDLKSITLTSAASGSAQMAEGRVRYEVTEGQVNFSLTANLPTLTSGKYQVWLKSAGRTTKAMVLEMGKGGWVASGAISSNHLPLEVIVSRESNDDDQPETVLLTGEIPVSQ